MPDEPPDEARHCKNCGELIFFDIQIEEWIHYSKRPNHYPITCDIDMPRAEPE